jgi:hypothetical protein
MPGGGVVLTLGTETDAEGRTRRDGMRTSEPATATRPVSELNLRDGADRPAVTEHDPVVKLIGRTPVFVSLDTTLRQAAGILTEESIGAALVRGPAGRPACCRSATSWPPSPKAPNPDRDRVRDFMTPDIASVPRSATSPKPGNACWRTRSGIWSWPAANRPSG